MLYGNEIFRTKICDCGNERPKFKNYFSNIEISFILKKKLEQTNKEIVTRHMPGVMLM